MSWKPIISAVLCVVLLFSLSGCLSIDIVRMTGASINESGELILSYSNGTEKNLGTVVGKDGVNGQDGTIGQNGVDGQDGTLNITTDKSASAFATAKSLSSSVRIVCNFSKTVQSGFPNFGSNNQTQQYASAGSGVIYRFDKSNGEAFIITNYHVVYDSNSNTSNGISDNISVYLYGSETTAQAIPAEYVGGSPHYDIAVLWISDSEVIKASDASAVEVADSEKIQVGQTAIAIGNPEGMGISVSSGIVSVDSEYLAMKTPDNASTVSTRVIRIDTAVNPGNSGGGLFDDEGKLIGIVNAKVSSSSVENIAFAIPSNIATAVANNIIDNCFGNPSTTMKRGFMGISVGVSNSYAEFDQNTGRISIKETVSISKISNGSLIDGALEVGDILLSVSYSGKTVEITRGHHALEFMIEVPEGAEITFKVKRGADTITRSVTLTSDYIREY